MGEARKDDAGKPRMDLLPWSGLETVAEVMTFGADKYGERNYQGLDHSRLFAAALRHLSAWWQGEDLDPETELPHIAHAACCVLMLTEMTQDGLGEDDRP